MLVQVAAEDYYAAKGPLQLGGLGGGAWTSCLKTIQSCSSTPHNPDAPIHYCHVIERIVVSLQIQGGAAGAVAAAATALGDRDTLPLLVVSCPCGLCSLDCVPWNNQNVSCRGSPASHSLLMAPAWFGHKADQPYRFLQLVPLPPQSCTRCAQSILRAARHGLAYASYLIASQLGSIAGLPSGV